jgi:hypothetical protein
MEQSYNGNAKTAINQYYVNKNFANNVDNINAGIDIAKKITPQLGKSLKFSKDVLTCLKSDSDAVIVFSKLLFEIVTENPIGKLIFKINEAGFDSVFKMLIQYERIHDLRMVIEVIEDFVINSRKASDNLLIFKKNIYLQGPISFSIKKAFEAGITLDSATTKNMIEDLSRKGKHTLAAHDFLLNNLVSGHKSIYAFLEGLKVPSPASKTIFEQLGNGIISKDIEFLELFLNQENFYGMVNRVLRNRNEWANWCSHSERDSKSYL